MIYFHFNFFSKKIVKNRCWFFRFGPKVVPKGTKTHYSYLYFCSPGSICFLISDLLMVMYISILTYLFFIIICFLFVYFCLFYCFLFIFSFLFHFNLLIYFINFFFVVIICYKALSQKIIVLELVFSTWFL